MTEATTTQDDPATPLLGPCPCRDCHLPLFMVRGALGEPRWQERHWVHVKDSHRGGYRKRLTLAEIPPEATVAKFMPHVCTAALPAAVPFLTLDMTRD